METQTNAGGMPGNPLGNEKIGKLLLRFSVPCILSLLVSALYNIVDQIFIGQGVGYLGNAATNVVYPVTVIALGFSLLIGDGCAALDVTRAVSSVSTVPVSISRFVVVSCVTGVPITRVEVRDDVLAGVVHQ